MILMKNIILFLTIFMTSALAKGAVTEVTAPVPADAPQAAQEAPKPVTWKLDARLTDATSGVITLTAVPAAGWHLYGTELPAGGPQATKIDLSKSTGIILEGAPKPSVKPVTVADKLFDMTLNWWDKPVTFTVPFKLKQGARTARIKAEVNFMACDDNTCAPPVTETLFKSVRTK